MPVFDERVLQVRGRECRVRLESLFHDAKEPDGINVYVREPDRWSSVCWIEDEVAIDEVDEALVLQNMADEVAAMKRNPSPFTQPDFFPWIESFDLPEPRKNMKRFWER